LTLPRAAAEAFVRFGVPSDTIAWIDDLYRHLGAPVVEVVAQLVEEFPGVPSELRPEHLESVRARVGERYLRAHHASWKAGRATAAFWRDRSTEGMATGAAMPLGDLESRDTPLAARVAFVVRAAAGENQPAPRGILMLSQNAHRGNQEGTLAMDLVPAGLEDALALNAAHGRQHTLPGSVGETSGRTLAEPPLAIVWEIQPNVYKPSASRNRGANAAWRRHRLWPLATSVAAFAWLREKRYRVYVLRGLALKAAHQVNPAEPIGPEIERLHEATVARAAAALALELRPVAEAQVPVELARLAKVDLGRLIEERGLSSLVWELT
jgi:hypothetical protein